MIIIKMLGLVLVLLPPVTMLVILFAEDYEAALKALATIVMFMFSMICGIYLLTL